jgi:5-methylcytosine-specific restriction enzyme A
MGRLRMLQPTIALLDTRTALPIAATKAPKPTDPFYGSIEHKRWRQEVARRAGYRCEWPGCDKAGKYSDHVIERKDDPSRELDPSNGMFLCSVHHGQKTAAVRSQRRGSAKG